MRTKNAKELASIISLLLSKDYESVMLGISLFSNHYLITNYPKYKKFNISFRYRGYKNPSQYCASYSHGSKEFNKSQFLKMLASEYVDIRKKTCGIINFIYDQINLKYIQKGKKSFKNLNYNNELSSELWGSSLDTFQPESIKPRIYHTCRSTQEPISKKKYIELLKNITFRSYFPDVNLSEELLEDFQYCHLDTKYLDSYSTPRSLVEKYKQFLQCKFKKKEKQNSLDFRINSYLSKAVSKYTFDNFFEDYLEKRYLANSVTHI